MVNGGGTYPNLFDAHPPFQIDGNFGGTSGIAEMLIQSHDGSIVPLPALPKDWDTGSFRGLHARGAFTVSATWAKRSLMSLHIVSELEGPCRVTVPSGWKVFSDHGREIASSYDVATKRLSFETRKGEGYEVRPSN